MVVSIRGFLEEDVPYKVKWINDETNNKYLHYELPLKEDKTLLWFRTLKNRYDRADYTILYNDEPAGLIGILSIDKEKNNAEYYICLGGDEFKGKGIAKKATELIFKEAFYKINLKEIYLYTEYDNVAAQKSFEKSGFIKQKLIKNDIKFNGKFIDRYYYTVDLENYFNS